MRADLDACAVQAPGTLAEALALLAAEPGRWRPLAGGTDLMVPFAAGRLPDTHFLSLHRLRELRAIEVAPDGLRIGALATFTELLGTPELRAHWPNLASSARVTGALAIQNRATLGGNIVNASPAADSPPALLAYGARVELSSQRGSRWLDYADFHTGYRQTLLAPDELLTRIHLPRPGDPGFHFYRKVGTRAAQAVTKVGLAAHLTWAAGRLTGLGIALASVAPVPLLARRASAILLGQPVAELPLTEARAALQEDLSPIDDVRSTARYRRRVAGELLLQMLAEAQAVFRQGQGEGSEGIR